MVIYNQWVKFYDRMLIMNLDFLLRILSSSYLHPVEPKISFFLGPTKLLRFSATVCLSHIRQFMCDVYQEQNRSTVMEPLLKTEEIQRSSLIEHKILFDYFINHTTHLIYYLPIIVIGGNNIFLAHK